VNHLEVRRINTEFRRNGENLGRCTRSVWNWYANLDNIE
jgi:hypothetical protein